MEQKANLKLFTMLFVLILIHNNSSPVHSRMLSTSPSPAPVCIVLVLYYHILFSFNYNWFVVCVCSQVMWCLSQDMRRRREAQFLLAVMECAITAYLVCQSKFRLEPWTTVRYNTILWCGNVCVVVTLLHLLDVLCLNIWYVSNGVVTSICTVVHHHSNTLIVSY